VVVDSHIVALEEGVIALDSQNKTTDSRHKVKSTAFVHDGKGIEDG
jgi:hypothetical protein